MMTQVDEIDRDKHINMTFVEFLDAVVRVAEKVEIPHCVDVSQISDKLNDGSLFS